MKTAAKQKLGWPGPRKFRRILFVANSVLVLEKLHNVFGFSQLHGVQDQVIAAALAGDSTLVVMPTGGGKSLCYQLPPLVSARPTLVLSPLIALMKDQVDRLRGLGIDASYINSTVPKDERERRLKRFVSGKVPILYVTPERFRKSEFVEALRGIDLGLLAVDEAHCVSQWGHDFRPEYSRVPQIRKLLGDPPVMDLTATATLKTQTDLCQSLGIKTQHVYRAPVRRDNLRIQVIDLYGEDSKLKALWQLIASETGPQIVYFSLISQLERVSDLMSRKGVAHVVYHGGLGDRVRRENQELFMSGQANVVFATPAFGLGVDKANVRQVIHFELPGSIEAYFQEIGRAGRDGQPSHCVLLFDQDDIATQMDFIKWSNPDAAFIERVYRLLERNPERVRQEGYDFLRSQMNFYNKRDFRVETAVGLLRAEDLVVDWQIVAPFDAGLFDSEKRELRARSQHMKLLDLVKWAQTEGGAKIDDLYRYFGEAP